MTPEQLLKDYADNRKYGSIEFHYSDGNIVFVKKVETLKPAAYGNNSMAAPRGEHGVNHRDKPEN